MRCRARAGRGRGEADGARTKTGREGGAMGAPRHLVDNNYCVMFAMACGCCSCILQNQYVVIKSTDTDGTYLQLAVLYMRSARLWLFQGKFPVAICNVSRKYATFHSVTCFFFRVDGSPQA